MSFDFDKKIERRGTGSEKWVKYEQTDILPMWVADMDFASPPSLVEALTERVRHGVFGYAHAQQSLYDTVIGMCESRYGWKIEAEWIVWLPGLVCGINVTSRAIGERGDDAITAVPVYPPFLSGPKNQGRGVVTAPLRLRDGRWELDQEKMERVVTPKTGPFRLCHGHRRVGRECERGVGGADDYLNGSE